MAFYDLSIPEIILFSVFLLSLGIQLVYNWGVFTHLAFYKSVESSIVETQPVSVVICARNEAVNLQKYLKSVLNQNYPDFQVVVVNDCSWDESQAFLEQLEDKYSNLKVLTIKEQEKYRHGKKFALTLGIKAAQNEILLFTDADCEIPSPEWIRRMQSNFDPQTEFVLGYGPYMKKAGFLNRMIRFDAFFTALQYFSFSMMGMTYMGVGRNLAYRKSVFFRNKGFASHQHILSGDDDLFVNEVARKGKVKIELNPESFTYSESKNSFSDWFRQKKRHISTGKYYRSKHKAVLGIFGISHILFYLSFITLLIIRFDWRLLIVLFLLRLLSQLFVYTKGMKVLGEKDLWWMSPFMDAFNVFFYPVLQIANWIFKTNKWK